MEGKLKSTVKSSIMELRAVLATYSLNARVSYQVCCRVCQGTGAFEQIYLAVCACIWILRKTKARENDPILFF
jgi:hypothetical protein